ncbi:sigma-54-dependent transcriptional regulator [Aureispira anguillae]|uniref:Sigma-54 dependent transcriptional regulator n=1 Tax=Aureispira anguillae TaxID=2864201 RepID=A0A916DVM4_9BACT|nr:sigma-54 dependent transcriptional regulator [Aureispira anguillae]BDS13720.1 sigma-54 dependent transcriptional regulator [Aureispira anguillae]
MEYSRSLRIFVVEDDPMQQRIIKYVMESNPEHEVHTFATGQECLDHLYLQPQLISLDYNLPDLGGAEVLEKIKQFNPEIRVIVLSGQKNISTAIDLLKQGANDYITKDTGMKERLRSSVELLKQNIQLKKEVGVLREQLAKQFNSSDIIGQSPSMKAVCKLTEKAAKSNIIVSITGETGTGKEVIAKSIHYNSSRRKKRFVAVNMAAIPKELIESELFGHEKGAFTGAITTKAGKFELANGGTLFLDEIGDLDLPLQAKLLRALQEQEITRIGGNETIKFDARIITATHKNLFDEVHNGKFREDLYYRLLGLSIELPPLRKRGNDVLVLAKHFLRSYAKSNNVATKTLSQEAKDLLLNHQFPGNVRELKSIIELAMVLSDEKQIKKEHLQLRNRAKNFSLLDGEMTIRDYTKKIIHYYLEKYNNDVTLISKKLEIGRSTIYKLLKEDSTIG